MPQKHYKKEHLFSALQNCFLYVIVILLMRRRQHPPARKRLHAPLVKLVYTLDLGSNALRRKGSSPLGCTIKLKYHYMKISRFGSHQGG